MHLIMDDRCVRNILGLKVDIVLVSFANVRKRVY